METTKINLSDLRSLEINKEEIFYSEASHKQLGVDFCVRFYGSHQIMDGLFIMN